VKAEAFDSFLATVNQEPGVYIFKDADGRVVYVGKAVSLRDRLRSYAPPGQIPKQGEIVEAAATVETLVTRSELEAFMLEATLIQKHHPHFNVSWRDDKSYPFLELTLADEFPRIYFTRRKARKGGKLYGPYTAGAARHLQRLINEHVRVPSCTVDLDGKQTPCLYHYIHWCDAPCAGKITAEAFGRLVVQARMFLEGRTKELVAQLEGEMAEAAAREDFELAGMLRDRIRAVGMLHEDQAVIAPDERHADVIGLARSGSFGCIVLLTVREGKLLGKQEYVVRRAADVPDAELVEAFVEQHYAVATPPARVLIPCELESREVVEGWLAARREGGTEILSPRRGLNRELLDLAEANAKASLVSRGRVGPDEAKEQLACAAEVLELIGPPNRIEAVDLSHLHGEEAVGAVVVLREGLPSNREHRRYLIKTARGGDDYASMHEVVLRRLRRLKEEGVSLPDLLLLDGGAGQLKAAGEACAEAGVKVPLVALAKREELLYLPGRDAPVTLPSDSPALHLLQRARDEAHRYVNAYQRRRRKMVLREDALHAKRAMKRAAAAVAARP